MNQKKALKRIRGGDTAYGLMIDKLPGAVSKFDRITKNLSALLREVKKEFPDASYYSSNGALCLLLGESHDSEGKGQQELVVTVATGLTIDGGDW